MTSFLKYRVKCSFSSVERNISRHILSFSGYTNTREMPISSRRWRFLKACAASPKRKKGRTGPDVNHNEIARRALTIFRIGIISKEEYKMIIEADLKCRCRHDVLDSHVVASARYDVDPITLEELGPNKYTYTTPNGTCIQYNLETIIHYFTSTGEFKDPVTRIPMTEEELAQLDMKAQEAGIKAPSLVCAMRSTDIYRTSRQQAEELRGLEACLGELVVEALRIVERKGHGSDAELRLSMILSEFEQPFKEMKRLNHEAAYQALISWMVFLKGPPKKPTRDISGTLNSAISFLEAQWTAEDNEKLKHLRESCANKTY